MLEILRQVLHQVQRKLKNDFKQVRFIYVCRLYAVHLGLCRLVRLAHLADAEPIKIQLAPRRPVLLRLNLNKKKVRYFSGISKVLGLCLPIIYNRMKGEQYDILIFIDWCLLGWFTWGRSFTINFVNNSILLLTIGTTYGIM